MCVTLNKSITSWFHSFYLIIVCYYEIESGILGRIRSFQSEYAFLPEEPVLLLRGFGTDQLLFESRNVSFLNGSTPFILDIWLHIQTDLSPWREELHDSGQHLALFGPFVPSHLVQMRLIDMIRLFLIDCALFLQFLQLVNGFVDVFDADHLRTIRVFP